MGKRPRDDAATRLSRRDPDGICVSLERSLSGAIRRGRGSGVGIETRPNRTGISASSRQGPPASHGRADGFLRPFCEAIGKSEFVDRVVDAFQGEACSSARGGRRVAYSGVALLGSVTGPNGSAIGEGCMNIAAWLRGLGLEATSRRSARRDRHRGAAGADRVGSLDAGAADRAAPELLKAIATLRGPSSWPSPQAGEGRVEAEAERRQLTGAVLRSGRLDGIVGEARPGGSARGDRRLSPLRRCGHRA